MVLITREHIRKVESWLRKNPNSTKTEISLGTFNSEDQVDLTRAGAIVDDCVRHGRATVTDGKYTMTTGKKK